MREAELFDGTVLEFPDSTPDDVIARTAKAQTLARRQPTQPQQPAPTSPPSAGAAPGMSASVEDSRPWYAKAGQAADDLARLAAGELTFGFADKLAGYLGGEGTEAERAKTEAARQRAGLAGTLTEIASGVAVPLGLANKGLSLARGIPRSLNNIATRAVAGGAEGAGYGALSAAGHDEDIAQGAKVGAILGTALTPASELASRFVQGASGLVGRAPTTTADELKAAASRAYATSEQAGVVLKPNFVSGLRKELTDTLANEAYSPRIHEGVNKVLAELDSSGGQNITLKGLENVRRLAGDLRTSTEPGTARLGGLLTQKIDDTIGNLNQTHILTGNATAGVEALKEARLNWAQARKAEMAEGLLQRAQDRAGGALGSLDSAIRTEARAALRSPEAKFLTGDEKRALRQVIYGDTFGNTVSALAAFAPQAGVLRALTSVGSGVATGGATVPLSAVGAAANPIAGRAAQNRVYSLARVIANGGVAPPAIQNAVQRLADPERAMLANILKGWGIPTAVEEGAGSLAP